MSEDIQLVVYRGFGTRDRFFLKARALRDAMNQSGGEDSSLLANLAASFRRLESDEVPDLRVMATWHGRTWEAVSDAEGYVDFELELPEPADPGRTWHSIDLCWMDPETGVPSDSHWIGEVMTPDQGATFGVISDLDDTVLQSYVTTPFKMALTSLLANAHTRQPFPGVAAFYRALVAGGDGRRNNPIFYVSSSPWNFYDLLVEFLVLNDIPPGPMFLRDYGLNPLRERGHHDHKLVAIRCLLETYPGLPFVLIGDSGQQDPEIYAQVVDEQPDRIRSVYIRDVTKADRATAVQSLAAQAAERGVEFYLMRTTGEAARHAANIGLILPIAVA